MTRNWASNIRKIQKTGGASRYITIPANLLRELGWKERQKVIITRSGKKLIITDWKK